MKVYNYHSEYKHFTGESMADESPLEPGAFLYPSNSTTIAPPPHEYGKVSVWNDGFWEQIEDHRGLCWEIDGGATLENLDPRSPMPNTTKIQPPEFDRILQTLAWDADGNQWIINDIPEKTPEEKLASAGLSVDELKSLLGLI